MINQQLINQLLINLLFAGLQVSKLVLSTVYCTPWRITLPSTWRALSPWCVSGGTLKIIEIMRKPLEIIAKNAKNLTNQ